MNELSKDLPFLLNKRGPDIQSINNSIIGQAGHKAWSTFLTDELGWTESKWRTFRSAYKYLVNHDYLRILKPRPNEIISLANKVDVFPSNKSEWCEYKVEIEN